MKNKRFQNCEIEDPAYRSDAGSGLTVRYSKFPIWGLLVVLLAVMAWMIWLWIKNRDIWLGVDICLGLIMAVYVFSWLFWRCDVDLECLTVRCLCYRKRIPWASVRLVKCLTDENTSGVDHILVFFGEQKRLIEFSRDMIGMARLVQLKQFVMEKNIPLVDRPLSRRERRHWDS